MELPPFLTSNIPPSTISNASTILLYPPATAAAAACPTCQLAASNCSASWNHHRMMPIAITSDGSSSDPLLTTADETTALLDSAKTPRRFQWLNPIRKRQRSPPSTSSRINVCALKDEEDATMMAADGNDSVNSGQLETITSLLPDSYHRRHSIVVPFTTSRHVLHPHCSSSIAVSTTCGTDAAANFVCSRQEVAPVGLVLQIPVTTSTQRN